MFSRFLRRRVLGEDDDAEDRVVLGVHGRERARAFGHQHDGGVQVAGVQVLRRVRHAQRLGVAPINDLGQRLARHLPLRRNGRDAKAQRLEPRVAQQLVRVQVCARGSCEYPESVDPASNTRSPPLLPQHLAQGFFHGIGLQPPSEGLVDERLVSAPARPPGPCTPDDLAMNSWLRLHGVRGSSNGWRLWRWEAWATVA